MLFIMPLEAQASIRVDTSLRAFARLWAIVRPRSRAHDHKSVEAAGFLFAAPHTKQKPPEIPAASQGVNVREGDQYFR